MYSTRSGLRRHLNSDITTNTKLTYPEHFSTSGICSVCVRDGLCEIGRKSKEGRALFPEPFGVAQFGAEKKIPYINDLQIVPELFGKEIYFHDVKTECTIGKLKVALPVVVAAMGSTKVANDLGEPLAIGSAKAGIPMVIGENILITFGKEGLKKRIQPYLNNYKKQGGVVVQGNPTDQKCGVFDFAEEFGAHAIELKLGQGAKQGLGGEIKFTGDADAKKYEEAGYRVVKNADGSYQRHAMPGSLVEEDLRSLLIKYSEYGLPIWAKIGMGRGILKLIEFFEKVKKEQGIPFECLTIDGHGGGTGMSPWLIMNETSIPSGSVFSTLEKKPGFDILLAGGYVDGADITKALMLGAKGVAMGRSMLIAASTDKTGGTGIVNYMKAIKEELQMLCATQRVDSVEKLIGKKNNLYPLSNAAARMFGIDGKNCF